MPYRERADSHRIYDMLNSSGMRCVLKSYVNWYVVSMLYHQPPGMTSTMIYENYRKGPVEPNMAREMRESRSCVIVHLNELEAEGIVQKGLFKQYMLTEKGRRIYENISKLTRDVKVEDRVIKLGEVIQVAVEKPASARAQIEALPEPEEEKVMEKELKPRIKEIEVKEIKEIKKSRIGIKRT